MAGIDEVLEKVGPVEQLALVHPNPVDVCAVEQDRVSRGYGGASTAEEMSGPELLKQISEQSGGRHLEANPLELPDIAAKIGLELRNRYILGYSPTEQQRDGRYHPVQVKVVPPRGLPPLHLSWRRGYYAAGN